MILLFQDGLLGSSQAEDRNYNTAVHPDSNCNGNYSPHGTIDSGSFSRSGGGGEVLSFHNIDYTVNIRKKACKPMLQKQILKDVK